MTRSIDKTRRQPLPPRQEPESQKPRGLARARKTIRANFAVTISITIALASATFTGLTWHDQYNADAAAAYLTQSHDASLVFIQLQQISHKGPQMVVVNDAHAPITDLTMFLPTPVQGHQISDMHAFVFSTLPDMAGCTEMTTNLMAIFKRDHLTDSAMGGAAVTFRDVNGLYWTRLASGQFFQEPKPKHTAGLIPIPTNLGKAPGCS